MGSIYQKGIKILKEIIINIDFWSYFYYFSKGKIKYKKLSVINSLKKFRKIKRYIQEFLVIFGFRFPKKTEDRFFLEKFIFDYLNTSRKILST